MENTKEQSFELAIKFMHENEQALADITTEVFKEICSSVEKHGAMPGDIIHRAAIVSEESGELIRACVNLIYESADNLDYEKHKKEVYKEALHTAATAIKFLLTLKGAQDV